LNTDSRTIYFDIGDSIFYLSHHSSVSGIQRVVVELWKHLQSNDALSIKPVAFDNSQHSFVLVDPLKLTELINMLDGSYSEFEITNFAGSLMIKHGKKIEAMINEDDVFVAAGSSWIYPRYFVELNKLKDFGIRVITLVYDLIPIVTRSIPQASKLEFTRYLFQLMQVSDRVATISQHTRIDLDDFAREQRLDSPPGPVTKLPGGFSGKNLNVSELKSFQNEPYILMVGTIEERKNHLNVLRAFEKTMKIVGAEKMPQLICVGRLGWNVDNFIDELSLNLELKKKVTLLTHSLDDLSLASLYKGALFTIYPSKYEGWGLPVSEALDFGVPVITSTSSSLPEAGENYAVYVPHDDTDLMSAAITKWVTDPVALAQNRSSIGSRKPLQWSDVANLFEREFEKIESKPSFIPRLELCSEYGFGRLIPIENIVDGSIYLRTIESSRSLPMTNQISTMSNSSFADFFLDGPNLSKDAAGETFATNTQSLKVRLKFRRSSDGKQIVHVAVNSSEKKLRVQVISRDGISEEIFTCGGVISTELSAQASDSIEIIEYVFHKISEQPAKEISVTFCSILGTDPSETSSELELLRIQLGAHLSFCGSQREVNEQIRIRDERIKALESSISWKLTSPLRALLRTVKNK
jgi:glycosyltransferase involved in cell wall biosynthesis